jgi:hypothetical protein
MKYQILGLACLWAQMGCLAPDDGGRGRRDDHHSGAADLCSQFTTCGTCTPILGCGWCSSGTKGLCAAEPNECAATMSFDWTWETSGCPAASDAGAANDASADSPGDAASPG